MNNAFVRNVEHFDNAIDLAGLESLEGLKVDNFEPQKFFLFPVGHCVLVLASGLQKTVEVPQGEHMDRIVDVTPQSQLRWLM